MTTISADRLDVIRRFLDERPRPGHGVFWQRIARELFAEVERLRASDARLFGLLCPTCNRGHVLDNGRVWGECGLWQVIGHGLPEAEAAAHILGLPEAARL